jgi:hypothetical protein
MVRPSFWGAACAGLAVFEAVCVVRALASGDLRWVGLDTGFLVFWALMAWRNWSDSE